MSFNVIMLFVISLIVVSLSVIILGVVILSVSELSLLIISKENSETLSITTPNNNLYNVIFEN